MQLLGGDRVDDIFLILAVLFSVGMMVLMVKYAKFIHKQPKIEAERRQNIEKDNQLSDDQN
jgi:hypothetical protein